MRARINITCAIKFSSNTCLSPVTSATAPCGRCNSCSLYNGHRSGVRSTSTNSLANEFSEILTFDYVGVLKIGIDKLSTLIPHTMQGENANVLAESLFIKRSFDQCAASRGK